MQLNEVQISEFLSLFFLTVMTKRKMETTVENNDEKIQKFGSHSIAPENTKELKKQKSNRKG